VDRDDSILRKATTKVPLRISNADTCLGQEMRTILLRAPASTTRRWASAAEASGTVNMNEQVGKWSLEHPGLIVGMCEAHEDRGESDHSHAGEKKIVRAAVATVANDRG
jgi:hypothetical protein